MLKNPVGTITPAFKAFFRTEAAGGVVLLVSAVIALIWVNSAWDQSYVDFWAYKLQIGFGDLSLEKALSYWVKDALMVVFFFLVGLEIKREMVAGELASPRRALLPAAAAVGGAVVPAVIYYALNAGSSGSGGWGIPMATDIAFALGVLALVGGKRTLLLRVFLAALAIVDDLLAVLVVAIFYSGSLNWAALGLGLGIFAALVIANRLGLNSLPVYLIAGFFLWLAFLESGVHSTVAGVLLAMTIPARGRGDAHAGEELDPAHEIHHSMLGRLEHALHPWVAFGIMPIFALANAGVVIEGSVSSIFSDRVTLGIVLGLILGKQIGITLATWAAVKSGLASLPDGLDLRDIYSVSWLGGIGFTMSIFIANLAFTDLDRIAAAKIGILAASTVAGLVGFVLLKMRAGDDPASATAGTNAARALGSTG